MIALLLPLLLADLLHLKGGQLPVEGKVEDDGKSAMVTVRRPDGSRISYPRDQVDRVELCPTPEEVYFKRRAEMGPPDARALLELGEWAQGKGMKRQAEDCFREVLRVDPENARALASLGFVRMEGVWMSEAEAHRLRGDRLLRGRWLAPAAYRAAWTREQLERAPKEKAEVLEAFRAAPGDLDAPALAEGLKSRNTAMREAAVAGVSLGKVFAAVPGLVDLLASPDGEALEAPALEALKAAGGRDALKILFQRGFKSRDEGGRLRVVRAAGALGDTRAAKTLVMLAVDGASWPLRQEAAKSLKLLNHRPAFDGLCAVLQQGDSTQRGRAAEALQAWGSEEAVPFLILALDLRDREGVDTGPRQHSSFQMPGGGSMGFGEGMSDDEALRALGFVEQAPVKLSFDAMPPEAVALEKITGQALGRDAAKWAAWWEGRKK